MGQSDPSRWRMLAMMLMADNGQTYVEIAKVWGVSHQRVAQILSSEACANERTRRGLADRQRRAFMAKARLFTAMRRERETVWLVAWWMINGGARAFAEFEASIP